ncbi:EcsC family protein [Reichenbachiella agarivorans]|uniref:EcsC family protein n=1 Tax=Reichenbachiella agarivorans TaxID=2979464 RepID=A0ABY6CTS8_9BACT|nr:EcsC family protein [Reichenbachiella agarivorans]UXP33922.1 EcsC family protein [Reichenbachiella agarivorans]
MNLYQDKINSELAQWKVAIDTPIQPKHRTIKRFQRRINRMIPCRVHALITKAIKETTRAALFGAEYTTPKRDFKLEIHNAEEMIHETIWFYASSAAAQGAFTGLGGIFSSIADFPLWLSIKMKMLFEIAGHYGFDTRDFKERLFILHVFQLAFANPTRRAKIYHVIEHWDEQSASLPNDIHSFDWKKFQMEYRDDVDLIKIFQLIPGIGAVVGACINHKLTYRLGKTAMNAYRLRIMNEQGLAIAN